jgi:hypothetical protein
VPVRCAAGVAVRAAGVGVRPTTGVDTGRVGNGVEGEGAVPVGVGVPAVAMVGDTVGVTGAIGVTRVPLVGVGLARGEGEAVGVGLGVVGNAGVAEAGTPVAVGDADVAVGCALVGVLTGGIGVSVGGSGVLVGASVGVRLGGRVGGAKR